MKKDKKKKSKGEELVKESSVEGSSSAENPNGENVSDQSDIDEFLGIQEDPNSKLTESQRKKIEKIDNVKGKISQILKSSNIEIVDENFDDEYEYDSADEGEKSQQDYDSLKALFGAKDKSKSQEVTLTIDDFDYTYVGQYLEEYDLMHMKNIRKVRIQRKHSKKFKKFLIAAIAVIVAGIGGFFAYYFLRETPVTLKAVTLNKTESNYYDGDTFNYSGLYFIAEYSDGTTKKIKLTSDYYNKAKTTGSRNDEDASEIKFTNSGNTNLVFTYGEFDVNYSITVSRKREVDFHVFYADGLFSLSNGSVINSDMIRICADYGDWEEEVPFSKDYSIYIDGYHCNLTNQGYVTTSASTTSSVILIRHGNDEKILIYGEHRV